MAKRSRPKARVVLVTIGNETDARAMARTLVGEGLAACVNVLGPINSIYRWHDAIEDEKEYLLLIKTRASLYGRVERRVKEMHSYDVPEVVALPIETGSASYLEWLFEMTAPSIRRPNRRVKAAQPAR